MRALSIGATGMQAQQLNVEVISNNLANMNTTGFKRSRAAFEDLLYQQVARAGAATSANETRAATGIQLGAGVKAAGVYRIGEQGALTQTGNRYDLAIDGRGYFRVALPDGREAYSRAGSFQLSATGELVTPDGYKVEPGITIPDGAVDVSITKTGLVEATLQGQTAPQQVGQLDLATFVNDAGLEAMGQNLLLQTAASGDPQVAAPGQPGFGTLSQGFLESSNVDPVGEITALITAQRAYDMNSRVIRTADEMLQTVAQGR